MPLINLFPNLIPKAGLANLECEWRELLNQQDQSFNVDVQLEEYWYSIFSMKNAMDELMFPNLSEFVGPLLALPHSSATAERIFSQLNLIKNKERNKLLPSTVDAIMAAKTLLDGVNADEFVPSKSLLNKYHKY